MKLASSLVSLAAAVQAQDLPAGTDNSAIAALNPRVQSPQPPGSPVSPQCWMEDLTYLLGYSEKVEVCESTGEEEISMDALMDEVDDELELEPRTFKQRVMAMAVEMITDYGDTNKVFGTKKKRSKKVLYSRLSNYGCWCNPNKQLVSARNGVAVDPMDEACKALYHCQKCLPIVHGESCPAEDGGNRKYKYGYYKQRNGGGVDCMRRKNNDCGYNTCQCAKEFAERVGRLFIDPDWEWNNQYWLNPTFVKKVKRKKPAKKKEHMNFDKKKFELFDFHLECTTDVGSGMTLDCCGVFPHIKPYNADLRSCCKNMQPYETNLQSCCDDGSVRAFGDC